jgi:putative oligomerization/nucleic acid binding protein
VRFEQGILDRMIGAGTLVVQSASEAGRQVFDHIRDPEGVQKTIYHQGELNQQRMSGGSGGRTHSTTSELERLADLHARGVLTEEEFQAQKRRLLG